MDNEADPNCEIVMERLMKRLEGLAVDIGLDEETTRHIVERVITDMPFLSDEDRLARSGNWVLIAST